MEKPSTKKPMNVLKTMVFLKNFMENSTRIIRINSKIYRALERILEDFPDHAQNFTISQFANELLDYYIRTFYENGNDYIDRDD